MLNAKEMTKAYPCKEGWYFERRQDGKVHIFKRDEKSDGKPIVAETDIDPGVWASVVSFVSAGGETGDRFQAALEFHVSRKPYSLAYHPNV